MRSSVLFKNKLIIGSMTLSRILMMPCEIFWRKYFSSISSIALVGSSRVIVDGNRYAI